MIKALARLQSLVAKDIKASCRVLSSKLGKLETFLESIGITKDMCNGKPTLSKNKRTWEVYLTEESYDTVEDTIRKALGTPTYLDEQTLWILKGKGTVSYSASEDIVRVSSLREKDIPNMIIDIVDSYDSDTRAKEYSFDLKKKTIEYKCYEHYGKRLAAKLFKQLLKRFGLQDWTVNFPAAHWGTNR